MFPWRCVLGIVLCGSAAVRAAPPLVLTLDASVSASAPRLLAGTSSTLTATLANAGNADVTRAVRNWVSSAPQVASVDSSGRVSAFAPGQTTITASLSPVSSATLTLAVRSIRPPAFIVQPVDSPVGAPIVPGVQVRVQDNLGDPLRGIPVAIAIGNRPAPGTLIGTTSALTSAAGVATFPGLAIDWLGEGYTLVVSVTTPGGDRFEAVSQPFDELRVGDRCLAPVASCASGCPDRDGDGLNDAWENAGGIDMNGDGLIDAKYDALLPGADPDRPDIYVRYDYMGWDAPGAACSQDADCRAGGAQPNLVCHEQRCNHDHRPDPRALELVVAAFARHGVALHVDPNPREVPHSRVVTFARASDPGNGPKAVCAGADLTAGVLGGFAVSFFDLKRRFFEPARALTHHYVMFAHSNSCLTDETTATVGNCNQCPSDRATPSGRPAAGASGVAELPGNDLIVSLAQDYFNPIASVPRSAFAEAGVFMHELGHNLGLHHSGDVPQPESPPNYLSVMNPRYVLSGITQGPSPGSSDLVACGSDADCTDGAVCRPILPAGGRCTRIDYSTSTLATLDEGSLDEMAGVSPLASGLKDHIRYEDAEGVTRRGPAAGPVDWSGDGLIAAAPVIVDLNGVSGAGEVMRGYNDWDHGACTTSADCPVNAIRLAIHDLIDANVDPREPCLRNRCQPQWRAFQCTPWGSRD